MTLGSPSFEKKMRERLRALFKNSPDLRKERRKASRLGGKSRSSGSSRFLTMILGLAILTAYTSANESLLLGSLVVSLWAIGSAFKLGAACLASFYGSVDLFVLHHLPLSHAHIFRIQGRKFLKRASWALVDFALAYTVLTLLHNVSLPAVAGAVLAGLFQGGLVLALGIHLAARLPQAPLAAIGGALRTAAIFLLVFGDGLNDYLPSIASVVDLSNPAGWVNYAFRQVSLQGDWWMLGLLAPLAMIIWAAQNSWRRLQIAYNSLDEMELEFEQEQNELEEALPPAQPRRKGLTELTDEIHGGDFRAPAEWEKIGWIERLLAQVWTKREKAVADILLGTVPKWSRVHHRTAVILALCMLLLMLLKEAGQIVIFVGAYILITSTCSIFAREWRGLDSVRGPGGFIPFYAFYPIGYLNIVGVLWKVNFIRWLASAPYYIIFGLFSGWVSANTAEAGLDLALKIYFLLFCLQPLIIFFTVSSGTNDSTRGTVSSVLMLLLIYIPLFVVLLALGINIFLAPDRFSVIASLSSIFVVSLLLLSLQWVGYRRGFFDLVSNFSGKSDK